MIHHIPTICFPFVGDLVGGSHISTLGLIAQLDRARFRPIVLTQQGDGAIASLFRAAGVPVGEAPPSPELGHGTRLNLVDFVRIGARVAPLRRALRNLAVDIVHTNDGRTHATWAMPARSAGAKLVWHHRGSADALGQRYFAPLLADRIIAVSDYADSGHRLLAKTHSDVIYSPFDTEVRHDRHQARRMLAAELGCGPKAHLVGYSGALIDRKRPHMFVHAIALLRHTRPDLDVHGVIFGEPLQVSAQDVRERAASLCVADGIHLMGFRTPGSRWLAACDALLVPAVDEPFGRTLIEAMLVGTPIVAARSGGNAEALRDGALGLLVPPDDPHAMADALAALFDQPVARRRFIAAARKDARGRFGMERHAQQVMAVYDRLLGHPHPAVPSA